MGLSNFPSAAEGVLPMLVMNTLLSVALLKNLLKSALDIMGANWVSSSLSFEEDPSDGGAGTGSGGAQRRRVAITQFKSFWESQTKLAGTATATSGGGGGSGDLQAVECSVCLNKFEADEEVSELSCKHFFHRSCLDKWFDNQHSTCPLCRSIH